MNHCKCYVCYCYSLVKSPRLKRELTIFIMRFAKLYLCYSIITVFFSERKIMPNLIEKMSMHNQFLWINEKKKISNIIGPKSSFFFLFYVSVARDSCIC